MSKNTDTHDAANKADDAEQKPSDSVDHPPLWSPWNFQNKKRDWHDNFYGEIPNSE
jgi:hypothetical protein